MVPHMTGIPAQGRWRQKIPGIYPWSTDCLVGFSDSLIPQFPSPQYQADQEQSRREKQMTLVTVEHATVGGM